MTRSALAPSLSVARSGDVRTAAGTCIPSAEGRTRQIARQAARARAQLAEALQGQHALVENVSDMRAMFRLRGTQVRDVLAKLAPVDFARDALPVGELRRTRFAQVAAGVWLSDDTTAQVFCFRSVAEYMFNLLRTAADPDAFVGFHTG